MVVMGFGGAGSGSDPAGRPPSERPKLESSARDVVSNL